MLIGCWTSLSLNWCAEFMQLDFLSTKECALAGLRVGSAPPQVEIFTVICCCWAAKVDHLRHTTMIHKQVSH